MTDTPKHPDVRGEVKAGPHEDEDRFREFFEDAPVCCYMVSPDGTALDDVVGCQDADYGDIGPSVEHELTSGLSDGASACIGWATGQHNDERPGLRRGALNSAEAEASVTWSPSGLLYLRPCVAFSLPLDAGLCAATERPWNVAAGPAIGRDS